MKMCLIAALATVVFVLTATESQSATLTTTVVADTYIRESQANTNQDNDGDNEIIVGTNGTGDRLNGLFRFDLSALAGMAGPSEIIQVNSVTLNATTAHRRRQRHLHQD